MKELNSLKPLVNKTTQQMIDNIDLTLYDSSILKESLTMTTKDETHIIII